MKKFFINKNEAVEEIIDRVLKDPESEIIVVVPRDSVLKESHENFLRLKKEITGEKKNIIIESVDDDVLSFAKRHGLEYRHPLFHGDHAYSLSDIISTPSSRPKKQTTKHAAKEEKISPKEKEESEEIRTLKVQEEKVSPALLYRHLEEQEESKTRKRFSFLRSRRSRKPLAYLIGFGVIVLFGMWFVGAQFGKASITLNFHKTPWIHEGEVLADKTATTIDAARGVIPGELFTQRRNTVQSFPASGRDNVTQHAGGQITIYNAYSSASQDLVEKTRFVTPDGKIFRLVSNIKVPGAEVKDGKIIPSSIEAEVVADKPGEEYNVGPIEYLTVPGFQGTAKYEGFYGELKTGTSGGYIGEKAVPTESDISAAEKKTREILETALQNELVNGQPEDIKIIDGASRFEITKLTVNRNTDGQGNFSVLGEALRTAVGFRESDLHALFGSLAVGESSTSTLENISVDFSEVEVNFETGTVSFSVVAKADITGFIDEEKVKTEVLGKTIDEARPVLLGVPGINDVKVSLWPRWITRIPGKESKIDLVVY